MSDKRPRRSQRGGVRPVRTPTGRSARWRSWLDRISDAFGPRQLRELAHRVQRAIGLTPSGQVAVIAAVGIWVAALVVAGTAMYLFAYGAALLVIASLAIAPRRLRLEGERAGLFPRALQGDRLDVELTLTARRRVSTFVLEERVPERLGTRVRVPITKMSSGSTLTHHYALRCGRRGVYQVGPLVAVASDPLGLAERETVVCEPFELLVHPRIELVADRPLTRQFEDPPIRPPVSKPWPDGLELYGIREYVPGDDVRRIVWRASARAGKVMVREAEQGVTDRVTIILDTDRGSHSRDGEGLSESFETGVRAAASLAVRHLREGYEVRNECNAGPLTRPVRGVKSQLAVLDAYARVEVDRHPLTEVIRRLLVSPQRDAHNILVTPRISAMESAQLKLLLDTGVSILVVALLWDEANASTAATAAALGCQVVAVRPGQDLSSALFDTASAGVGIG